MILVIICFWNELRLALFRARYSIYSLQDHSHTIYLSISAFVSDGDQKKPSSSKGKAPKKMLSTELKEVAEGDEDMVEDLELSDQD